MKQQGHLIMIYEKILIMIYMNIKNIYYIYYEKIKNKKNKYKNICKSMIIEHMIL